ncbi:signal peptidase I [Luteimonas sp. MC1572]|uniref:signal peptidase I n=1 Tax=Luteimonas sp. MC1572 TaxID=2799325 RepID=UPI0018F064C1|nr:signal peptidase I [Luteimonas sp. MC1572]MBJ6981307.1 signal peptidase I [Luteimonas sp. MC1572]QQO02625.1 signal peptidase I [Luteimonas sp. MC1572]
MTQSTTAQGAHARLARLFRESAPLLVMLALLLVARSSFANHYVVPSGSMQPTLRPGDRVVVDMSAYGVRVPFTAVTLIERDVPRAGDVAVFKSPHDGTRLIKRVVAVAGDQVALLDGRLSINGRPLARGADAGIESFGGRQVALDLDDGGGPDIASLRVPPGKLLVLGDHRGASADGRMFGLVSADSVYARARGVYYRRGEGLRWQAL